MSLLTEYLKLYTNRVVIAMIMIILGVAIILYIIKRINEALEPSEEEDAGAATNNVVVAAAAKENEIEVQNWSEEDVKKFQRRDLIDHYAFYLTFKLYYDDKLCFEDKMTVNIRDNIKIGQLLKDMIQRQASSNPERKILLFHKGDDKIILENIHMMAEKLRIDAENRSKSGKYGYAPFAGMYKNERVTLSSTSASEDDKKSTVKKLIDTLKAVVNKADEKETTVLEVGKNEEPSHRRVLEIELLLLTTDFTEPFYLQYKFKQPHKEESDETTILEIQEEEEEESIEEAATRTGEEATPTTVPATTTTVEVITE